MPANYQQPEYVERRTRYFDGQFLKDQDFIDEQKYHIDRLRRSHKLLHIKGICEGLKVTVDNEKKTYEVIAGTAIDEQGRFIVLGENYNASFEAFTEYVDLYINYNEEESDITQAGNDTSEDDPQNQGVKGATRWWEKPIIKAYNTQEQNQIPPDAIYLARLILKDGDATVDSTPRKYSGIHLPSSNDPGPILQSGGDTAPSLAKLTGSLSISEQLGVGTVSSGIDLAIGDDDTGLNQEGENELAIYTDNKERLRIDASGNLRIGTKTPDSNYKLDVDGNTNVNGTIYRGGNPLIYENYEIYLRGSAFESTGGNNTYLRIANVSIPMNNGRGLNTVVLNPNGSYKSKITHDVFSTANNWNTWADWINNASNVVDGDVVAVASYDAIRNAPTGGSAETLLRAINALRVFAAQQGNVRSPYALLFIKGQTGAMEVSQPYKGPNAHLKTTYYELFNYGNSSVVLRGMIIMWSGNVDHIPHGWGLCDGNNGTPDLQDRFIVGAGSGSNSSYAPDQKGEPDQHQHNIDLPPKELNTSSAGGHNHSPNANWYNRSFLRDVAAAGKKRANGIDRGSGNVGDARSSTEGNHSHSLTIDYSPINSSLSSGHNRPKWYALCFIMKL
ncbi:phage tail protein [Mastigocoleus testarum]|uniref:Phage tail collar domain-containing protein n=1 Tax=Mastigocoleus testarum BC008 TaxID=371196 RepID=A0A0V7ZVF3_9CYAN|nr:phage tail protein [Mastigocoleus testarum]KST68628.1 hypothetical protein BC008_33825 [Mastigocoleus testarum BC008]